MKSPDAVMPISQRDLRLDLFRGLANWAITPILFLRYGAKPLEQLRALIHVAPGASKETIAEAQAF